jgi:hypothetical protein
MVQEADDASKTSSTILRMRERYRGNFLLKGLRPDRYKDRQTITLDLKDWDGDITKLSPPQVDELLAKALEKVGMTEESLQKAIKAGQLFEVQPEPADEQKP